MKKYKVETCQSLVESGHRKEVFFWSVDKILEEVNRDRSSEWTDYNKSDWKEGWMEWCENDWYTIKELTCDDCKGNGYVLSNDEDGNDEVQRCDTCKKFVSDDEALREKTKEVENKYAKRRYKNEGV